MAFKNIMTEEDYYKQNPNVFGEGPLRNNVAGHQAYVDYVSGEQKKQLAAPSAASAPEVSGGKESTMPVSLPRIVGPSGQPKQAEQDPNQQNFFNASGTQQYNAQQFRKEIPQLSGQYSNQLLGQTRKDLAGQIQNIKSKANARGLLHSGIRAGDERGAEVAAARAYIPKMSEYNKQLQEQADKMERDSITQGLNNYSQDLGMADSQWRNALSERQQQIENLNAIPNAVGGVFQGIAGGNAARGGGQQGGPAWVPQGSNYNSTTGRTTTGTGSGYQ